MADEFNKSAASDRISRALDYIRSEIINYNWEKRPASEGEDRDQRADIRKCLDKAKDMLRD